MSPSSKRLLLRLNPHTKETPMNYAALISLVITEVPEIGKLIAQYVNSGATPTPDQIATDLQNLQTSDADLQNAYNRLFPE